jgi:hypothetical protein
MDCTLAVPFPAYQVSPLFAQMQTGRDLPPKRVTPARWPGAPERRRRFLRGPSSSPLQHLCKPEAAFDTTTTTNIPTYPELNAVYDQYSHRTQLSSSGETTNPPRTPATTAASAPHHRLPSPRRRARQTPPPRERQWSCLRRVRVFQASWPLAVQARSSAFCVPRSAPCSGVVSKSQSSLLHPHALGFARRLLID